MLKQYEEELQKLSERMKKAEEFSKVVPLYAEQIIKQKLTGEERWHTYGDSHKKLYFPWGINRGFYRSGSDRYVSNYRGKHECYLWSTYINTISLYDSHEKYGLDKIPEAIDIFFFDKLNSTFYCTDKQIEPLLEDLNTWYLQAKQKHAEDSLQDRLNKAEAEAKEIAKKIAQLKGEQNDG